MEPQRYLRCLGQPILLAPNGEPIRFRTKKHLALLVFLAVDARSHRRERLAEFLWPRASMVEARHSLATALSSLRPRLGPDGLETSRDHVRLCPGRVGLDLQRLQSGDILGTEVTGPLEVAAFLDGFDIPDSTEFTHWKDAQQARLLPMIKDALVLLIDRCRRTGDSRQIEQLADRMLALDELSEEAIRAKMEARAFAGDRLTALEIFERWKQKLADELHAAPSDLVEGMAVRLRRRGWERTTSTNIPTVPTDQWRGRPFIGRTNEYRILYEAWEACRKGLPGHALVLGDSGVGKSTLVARLTTAAGLEGAAISRVQCYDLEREIPYSTVSGLILGLLDRSGVSATPPESLAELARTVPAVRHRFPSIPPSSESQGETARIRLTDAFHDMLTAIAEEHPVILVVDDLHFADDVSLAVLHLAMRRSKGQPIMVVMIARLGELDQSPQAEKLRVAGRLLGVQELEIPPLSDEESIELFKSLVPVDQSPPNQVRRTLLRAAGGYPMVLELLVQDWLSSGEQSLALSIDAMTAELGSAGHASVVYRDILARMTGSLDPITQSVLNLGSLLGRRLNEPSVFALVDLSVGQAMAGMAELVSRRVLRDGAHGLEFVNELVRAAAYIAVPTTLRRVLHCRIADRLMMEQESGIADLGLEIAWHSIRAGRVYEATPHLLRGAREAIRSGMSFAAERGLRTALVHLNGPQRLEALILLGQALQEQSRWGESLAALADAHPLETARLADVIYILTIKARRRLGLMSPSELAQLPAALLAFIEEAKDKVSSIAAGVEAASVCDATRSNDLAPLILERVSAIATLDLTLEDAGHLLLAKSMLLYNIGDLAGSIRCIQEGITTLEHCNSANSVLAMLHIGVGAIASKRADYASAVMALQKAYDIGTRIGNDHICLQASANLALSLTRLGEYETALDWASRAQGQSIVGMAFHYHLPAIRNALLSYSMLGRAREADTMLRMGRDNFAHHISHAVSQAWSLYMADAYAILGKTQEAESEGWNATFGLSSEPADFYVGPYARWVARTSMASGNIKDGRARLDALLLRLNNYDVVDQAELLNAKAWLNAHTGTGLASELSEMNERLDRLPAAVRDQLRRMGMMDFSAGYSARLGIPFPDPGGRPSYAP